KDGHEKDFFEGIDTTLPGLAARLGAEEARVPQLRQELAGIAKKIAEASEAAKGKDPSAAAAPLMQIVGGLEKVRAEVSKTGMNALAKSDLVACLDEKNEQAETALNDALDVTLQATVVSRAGPEGRPINEPAKKEADAITTVSPGQAFLVAVDFQNGSKDG